MKTNEEILAECVAIDKTKKAAAEKAERDDFNSKVRKIQKIRDLMVKSLQIKIPTEFKIFMNGSGNKPKTVGFLIYHLSSMVSSKSYYLLLSGKIIIEDTSSENVEFFNIEIVPDDESPDSSNKIHVNYLYAEIEKSATSKFGISQTEIKRIMK